MTTLTILVIAFATVAVFAALAKLAVRSDGYGQRSRPPSSRWPDIFDAPRWHTPRV